MHAHNHKKNIRDERSRRMKEMCAGYEKTTYIEKADFI